MSRPNIILIMTDQHRADQCSREGFQLDTMPYLDAFASEGTWFNRAYTANPTCLPARVSMLTGRWPSATAFRHNSIRNEPDLVPQIPVFTKDVFDVMHEAGYRTSLCGKNHSHLTADRVDYWSPYGHSAGFRRDDTTDEEAGFDRYLDSLHHAADYNPAPFPLEYQGPYRAVRDAIDWIDNGGEQPFFLWLSFAEPHNPFQVPEPYYDMFPPDSLPPVRTDREAWKKKGFKYEFTRWMGVTGFPDYDEQYPRARSNYLGMLRLIDDQIKRLVDSLGSKAKNTIIAFVADHGDFVGEYGLMRKGPEMPDCLMRIPFIWHGPGISKSATPHDAHVSLVDVFPTLCEAIGEPIPDGVQGRSLWPLLTGQEYPAEDFSSVYAEQGMGGLHYTDKTEIIEPEEDGLTPGVSFDCLNSRTQSGTMRTLRKGDWKLDFDMQGRGQLYNLAHDPAELTNLYGTEQAREKEHELLAELLAWSLRAQDTLPYPNIRYKLKTDPRNYWAPYRENT